MTNSIAFHMKTSKLIMTVKKILKIITKVIGFTILGKPRINHVV
jgi:hypothetical protein